MQRDFGGDFEWHTVTGCWSEPPTAEELKRFLIQVRALRNVDARITDCAIGANRAVNHYFAIRTALAGFGLWHKFSERAPIDCTYASDHRCIGRWSEKIGIKRTLGFFLCLLEFHTQIILLVDDVRGKVGAAIGKEIRVRNGFIIRVDA